MKIIHLITGLGTGGAERSLHNLLAGGLATHHHCHVICLTKIGVFGSNIAAMGVPVHSLEMMPGIPSLSAIFRLRRLVAYIKPNLLQGWMYHGNLAASVARVIAIEKPALVWNIRHSLYDISNEKPGTRAVIRAGKVTSRQPDHILYNSHVSRAQHETFGYHAAHGAVIANGFDTTFWKPNVAARNLMRTALGLVPSDKLVGFVGRYHPVKDIPNFLQAVAGLMAADPHIHCAIIGQDAGPENPALRQYFKALPEARCHVFGRRDDIAQLMPGFDLLCLSSISEAFPNVVGEAMACGVPCVTTDVGDCRHIVGDTGRIVATSDPITLYRALGEMLDLDDGNRLSFGRKARIRIESHFSLAATVDKYTNLYESILKGR